MKKFIQNWKTSFFGITSILSGAALIFKGQLSEGVTAVLTGLGLVVAKDHDTNF